MGNCLAKQKQPEEDQSPLSSPISRMSQNQVQRTRMTTKLKVSRKAARTITRAFDARIIHGDVIEARTAVVQNRQKSTRERALIYSVISQQFMFQQLGEQSMKQIIDIMKLYIMGPDEIILEQGNPGSNFFIINTGRLEVIVNNHFIKYLDQGDCFGELALLHDQRRTATIVTRTSCMLWVLDRMTFRRIIEQIYSSDYIGYRRLLDKVALLQSLKKDQKDMLTESIESVTFVQGDYIIKQGEVGDQLFLIKHGQVLVTQNRHEIALLDEGDFFGEQALMYHTVRTASVKAMTETVVCGVLSSESLQKALGRHLGEIININIISNCLQRSPFLSKLTAGNQSTEQREGQVQSQSSAYKAQL